MNRLAFVILTASISAGPTLAIMPPIPRIPAEVLRPADAPPANPDDPAAIADRIVENTKLAGDRLASADSGDQTRRTQNDILNDIDKLLKLAENPPPMGGGGSGSPPPPMGGGDPMGGQSGEGSKPPMPMGGSPNGGGMDPSSRPMGDSPMPMGGQPDSRPKGGPPGNEKKNGWRDRAERKQNEPGSGASDSQPMPGSPMPVAGTPKPMPGHPGDTGPELPVAPGTGGSPTGTAGTASAKSTPSLPLDDPYTKQVWGHLPEQMRQKMTQYYREQFVSKYGELLRQYYSSLAEREKAGGQR